MAKRTGLATLNSIAERDPKGGLTVTLPKSVRDSLPVMRGLNHRVVDVIADHGLVEWLVVDVEMRLTTLSCHIVGDFVTDLVRQAKAGARKSAKRDPT